MTSFYSIRFIKQMKKAASEIDENFQPRQSTRYREEAVFTSSVRRKERKARRTRLDVPDGPRGEFISSIVNFIKANRSN